EGLAHAALGDDHARAEEVRLVHAEGPAHRHARHLRVREEGRDLLVHGPDDGDHGAPRQCPGKSTMENTGYPAASTLRRPPRSGRSTTTAQPATSAPARLSNSMEASSVPPV